MGRITEQSKVYIVNKGYHDFGPAETFGEVVYLTEGRINVFSSDNLKAKIEEGLADAKETDYLCIAGHIIPNGIAMHVMLEKYGFVRLLVWIADTRKYKVVTLRK